MENLPQPKTFERVAIKVSKIVGSPIWFFFSLMLVIVWFPSRFLVKSDELWHLHINTTTTILTFLMMSLLHASQSRWEKRIENLENDQKKALKLIESRTEEIAERVDAETDANPNMFSHSNAHHTGKDRVTKLF